MTTGPRPHNKPDPDDPREPEREGRSVRGGGTNVFTSFAGNVAFLTVIGACGTGVLWLLGREAGMKAVGGVNAFALLTYIAFRRAFERVEATPVEALVSWLAWTVLAGAATACYALEWRVMGASVLALVLLLSLANVYFVAMRPDIVDDLMRRSRDGDDGPRR